MLNHYCGFYHVISKLGVPIKTTVSATVLEEALNGVVSIRPLSLGTPLCRKVWTLLYALDCPCLLDMVCS